MSKSIVYVLITLQETSEAIIDHSQISIRLYYAGLAFLWFLLLDLQSNQILVLGETTLLFANLNFLEEDANQLGRFLLMNSIDHGIGQKTRIWWSNISSSLSSVHIHTSWYHKFTWSLTAILLYHLYAMSNRNMCINFWQWQLVDSCQFHSALKKIINLFLTHHQHYTCTLSTT